MQALLKMECVKPKATITISTTRNKTLVNSEETVTDHQEALDTEAEVEMIESIEAVELEEEAVSE
jgi:hypothetical protein